MNYLRIIKESFLPGIISGVVLGLFLKLVESVFGFKVYTLLLNIDYIPILKDIVFPEIVDFSFHLVISVALSFSLLVLIKLKRWSGARAVKVAVYASLLIGILLYPTTSLSNRTPELTSISSFLAWLVGHGLYGWILGLLLKNKVN